MGKWEKVTKQHKGFTKRIHGDFLVAPPSHTSIPTYGYFNFFGLCLCLKSSKQRTILKVNFPWTQYWNHFRKAFVKETLCTPQIQKVDWHLLFKPFGIDPFLFFHQNYLSSNWRKRNHNEAPTLYIMFVQVA